MHKKSNPEELSFDKFLKQIAAGEIRFKIKYGAKLHIPSSVALDDNIKRESIITFILLTLLVITFPVLSIVWHQLNIMYGLVLMMLMYFVFYITHQYIKPYKILSSSIPLMILGSLVLSYFHNGLKSPSTVSLAEMSIIVIYSLYMNYKQNNWLKEIVMKYEETYNDAVLNKKIIIVR